MGDTKGEALSGGLEGDIVRYRPAYRGPGDLLRTGMRVRLRPGGPVCVVTRVNDCAAYVRRPYTKTITPSDGPSRTFEAMSQPEAISARAHVYLVEDEV
jgi:hypothetical protein